MRLVRTLGSCGELHCTAKEIKWCSSHPTSSRRQASRQDFVVSNRGRYSMLMLNPFFSLALLQPRMLTANPFTESKDEDTHHPVPSPKTLESIPPRFQIAAHDPQTRPITNQYLYSSQKPLRKTHQPIPRIDKLPMQHLAIYTNLLEEFILR